MPIAAQRFMTPDDLRATAGFRGQVELAWGIVSAIRARPDALAGIAAALDTVDNVYFRTFGELRKAVYAASENATYPVTAAEWVDRATVAIDTILKLKDEVSTFARTSAESVAARTAAQLWLALALLAVGLAMAGCSLWIVGRRVVTPITAMTAAMMRLAGGDKTVAITGLDRTDEVGAMAKAIQVFKDNAIEMERLEAEQAETKRRAEAEHREALNRLADAFEADISAVVQGVSSGSAQVEAAAQTVASSVEQTS
ncbi:MAG TPA: methyl-accepting chemotaxis protein, partial [Stellaceae bacterium]